MTLAEYRLLLSGWLLASLLMGVPAFAQDVSVRAYLSQREVGLNQQFVLNLEVTGTQQLESEPELPDLEAFAIYLGSGTSSSMQIVNGRTTVSVTRQYRYQATKLGTFQIGPFSVRAGGKTFTTEPLTMTVTAAPAQGPSGAGGPGGEAAIDPDDLFVTAEVSRRRVYENEPVVVEYRLYTRVNVNSYSITRLPGTAGFWVEEFARPSAPQVERVVRDGVQYATAAVRKVALFPTGPGNKTVEPLSIEAQVLVRRRSRDPFDDFFGEPLFGTRVPVVVASQPVDIEVMPLPMEGKPDAFSGFVGDLAVTAWVDSARVDVNQAVTLTIRVQGTGNLRALPEPRIAFPDDVEVYPPEISDDIDRSGDRVSGVRTFYHVFIPRAPGRKTIPSVAMSYFDPVRRTYLVAASEPVELEVTGDVVEGPFIGGRARRGIDQLREDIRFIRVAVPKFRPVERSLLSQPGFWMVLVVPLLVVGSALGVRRHRDRLEADEAFARGRRASRIAKKRFARARALLAPKSQREFYAEVGRALQGFLGDKLNLSAAGMISEDARTQLLERHVAVNVIDEYLACLEVCDRWRYAPLEGGLEQMEAFLERAEQAMTGLSQELSR